MDKLKKVAIAVIDDIEDLLLDLLDLPLVLLEFPFYFTFSETWSLSGFFIILYLNLGIVNYYSFQATGCFQKWTFIVSIVITSIYEWYIFHVIRANYEGYLYDYLNNTVPCHIGLIVSIYMLIKYF